MYGRGGHLSRLELYCIFARISGPRNFLDRRTCDLDRVSFGIEHKLIDPVMIRLEDIIL